MLWSASMTQAEKIAYWKALAIQLQRALTLCRVDIAADNADEIQRLIAYNELGLAWNDLCSELIESGVGIASEARVILLETGSRMGFDKPSSSEYDLWISIQE